MTVSGLTAGTTYYFAIKTTDDSSNLSDLSNVASLATGSASVNTAPGAVDTARSTVARHVTFSGQAYPGGKVELFRKWFEKTGLYIFSPIESSTVNADGTFTIRQVGLFGADFFFAVKATDPAGRSSGIISFDVSLKDENSFSAENIQIPPTVDFKNSAVTTGGPVSIIGYAAPNRQLEFQFDKVTVGTAESQADGSYLFATGTVMLTAGEHTVQVRQRVAGGEPSGFSSAKTFKVSDLQFPRADLNGDSVISITDWSIFLFNWQSKDAGRRQLIDFDDNDKIDITDLSLFLRATKL